MDLRFKENWRIKRQCERVQVCSWSEERNRAGLAHTYIKIHFRKLLVTDTCMWRSHAGPLLIATDMFVVHIPTVNHTQALKAIMLHNCFALSNPQSLINGVILPDAPCCSHGNLVADPLHTWHWHKSRTNYLNPLSMWQMAIDNGIIRRWTQTHTCTYTL